MIEFFLFALAIGVFFLLLRLPNLSARLLEVEEQLLDQKAEIQDLTNRLNLLSSGAMAQVEQSAAQSAPKEEKPQTIASEPEPAGKEKHQTIASEPELAGKEARQTGASEPDTLEKKKPQAIVPEPENLEEKELQEAEAEPVEAVATETSKTEVSYASEQPKATEPRAMRVEGVKSAAEWEALIGGNILNRVGAVALILGIGFFLKYAFDNNLISPVARVLMGAGAGVGLIVGGMRANAKQYEVFSQGLFGAGISALYLSIYAAFNFYAMLPQSIAVVLMSAVTAAALLIAVRYNSIAISILGWAGGFLTPFLLATAEPNAVGLFVYLALLNLGMLAITLLKSEWVVIELLSILATALAYLVWFSRHGDKTDALVKAFFLTLFWALFFASEAIRAFRNERQSFELRVVASAANAVLYFGLFYASVMPVAWFSAAILAVAGVYLATFFAVQKQNEKTAQGLLSIYSVGATLFLAAAIDAEFSALLTIALWAVEAACALWLAIRRSDKTLEKVAFFLFAVTTFRLFISPNALSYRPIADFEPILNLRVVAFLGLAISFFFSARLTKEKQPAAATIFDYAWSFIVFALLTAEVNDYFLMREAQTNEALNFMRSTRAMSYAITWLFYASLLIWFGVKQSSKGIFAVGLVALALGTLWNLFFGFRYEPIEWFVPILNLRALAFLLAIVAIAMTLSLLKQQNKERSATAEALRYAFSIVLFLLLTAEALDYFRWIGAKNKSDESFYRTLTLALLWTLYATPMLYFGIKKSIKPLLHAGAVALAIATLTTILRGLRYEPIENFTLVFNYRVGVYLALMYGAAVIAITLSKDAELRRFATGLGIGVALLGMTLLIAEANDFFRQKISALAYGEMSEITKQELTAQYENQKQLSISASLMLYSIVLMIYGIWRAWQPLRLTAITTFGIVILKIFLYDLSYLETLYRIFSFIGLGALLLLVSFLYQRYKHLILAEKAGAQP